jgi:Zn-finger nucleic acid-binding protein
MADRQGVEIDYCPQCRGVWLDRGELDKIIERSAPPPPPSGGRRSPEGSDRDEDYREGSHRDEPYRKKKRGGFLDELFDF